MPYSNNYSVKHSLKKLFMQHYERYLPTAFDESMSLLEKMNKLIHAQNQLIEAVNTHTQWTNETLERAFDIIDTNLKGQLEVFRGELEEQKRLYEEIRNKIHSELLPDAVNQKLEEWLLSGKIDELITGTIFSDFVERMEFLENIFFPPEDKITYYVPRDFPDLQSSIDFVRKIRNGIDTNIIIQSGFKPLKGIVVENHDLAHVEITSEDSEVIVDNGFTGNFIYGKNARMPVLATVVNMNNKGDTGYHIENASTGYVKGGCGVTHAGGTGLYVANSVFRGIYSVFTHHNDRNVWVTRSAVVSMDSAKLSHCQGGGVAVYISRSSIFEASNADMTYSNAEYSTISVLRSKATIMDADLSNSVREGINASQSAEVAARGVKMNNMGRHAVYAIQGARVDLLSGVEVKTAGGCAIYASTGATVTTTGMTTSDIGGDVIYASRGAKVVAPNVYNNRCDGNGVYAEQGSHVSVPDIRLYNLGKNGLHASNSSTIDANAFDGGSVIKACENNNVLAQNGSTIDCIGAELTGSKNHAIEVRSMSNVNAQSINSWDTQVNGAFVEGLSRCNLRNARLISNNVNVLCSNGSQIVMNGIETNNAIPNSTDYSPSTLNTMSSNGIIFHK